MRWLAVGVLMWVVSMTAAAEEPLVNLDHLRYLTEPVLINGVEMALVHIYSEYPTYDWVDDVDEGLSCVDDVARAAIVYRYEAKLPWETLGSAQPQAGTRIGFEAGRGIGGSSFMNLTGRDPDVAANLLSLTLTMPGSAEQLGQAPNVALEVRVDSGERYLVQQSVAPVSDYFWLDLITKEPLTLEAGTHRLRFEYAGEAGISNPGLSKVDAFLLIPVLQERRFRLPDGRYLALAYDTLNGQITWAEFSSTEG
jgi:hypothetical protein